MTTRRRAAHRAALDDATLALPFSLPGTKAVSSEGLDLDLGIDEAGRGPILGPMVLACVVLRPHDATALRDEGVCDSKRFGAGPAAHQARLQLAEHIRRRAVHVGVAIVAPHEIDARVGQLNHLEREHATRLIDAAPPCARMFADGVRLFSPLVARYPQLVAQDRAESAFVCVAAASIVAKATRDSLWLAICERYQAEFAPLLSGHAGGGYPNEATRRFLRAYYGRYRCLPPEARKSWPSDFLAEPTSP
ncbi:MAG: hypothetical protein JNJ46_11300 [Myxococcales bacterium]|nr:hypothetical protein [Myxococcales bacterium]